MTSQQIEELDTPRHVLDHTSESDGKYNVLIEEAKEATDNEHKMGIFESIRKYPKAIGWSVLASTALVMEGYDGVMIGSFYGYPTFQKKYGQLQPDGSYQITASWETGLSNGVAIGEILGLMAAGLIVERYGYRFTIGLALILVTCFIFITFFAVNIEMLLVGEILCGIPWGAFQTITTTYASEVAPLSLRSYLTTYVNLCWVFGLLLGSGVLRGMLSYTSEWGFRIPFALQWMWPVPLFIGICLAPESPWWLVRKGRYADAEKAVVRLSSGGEGSIEASKTVAMMIYTNQLEAESETEGSYWDCFKGTNLRRTEIVCMSWMIQTLCGNGLGGFSVLFFEQAGLSDVYSFDFNMGSFGLGALGVFCSWFAMAWFGRRTLYLVGLAGLEILLLVIGFVALAPGNKAAPWVTGTMLMLFVFLYDCTVGPVCYSLVTELPSSKLRNKTVVLARTFYNIVGILNNIITPRMISPTAWGWAGKAGFFWAGSCLLCLVWTYFRLPEPKGRTFAEIDILFEQQVPARKFKGTVVDPFAGMVGEQVLNHTTMREYEEKA